MQAGSSHAFETRQRTIGVLFYLIAGGLLAWAYITLYRANGMPGYHTPEPPLRFWFEHKGLLFIGLIGSWRYGWWGINLARSCYYRYRVFPRLRSAANATWESGWRPGNLHVLMTTYHERPEITRQFLDALARELRGETISATLWASVGDGEDESIIQAWQQEQQALPLQIHILHESQPGKRQALASLLQRLAGHGVKENDIVFLMDGDSMLGEGVLRKTLSCFGADKALMALTTDEEAEVEGPRWIREWFSLRFAQRRLWMQSHSLSGRVITLTGRMSAYRAPCVVHPEFISTVADDHLTHWLWGDFRFLSGDDKSTWYCMLKQRAKMIYVPDARVYTREYIEGSAWRRMRDNMLRWSGNMLRNGMRAIQLGPTSMPPFIWWCLIDQRIAVWTVPAGLASIAVMSIFISPYVLIPCFLWVFFTRTVMAMILSLFARKFHPSYPFILYLNQLLTSCIKIYLLFRLPRQKWANRHGVSAGGGMDGHPWRLWMARYLTLFYLALLLLGVLLLTGLWHWPPTQ